MTKLVSLPFEFKLCLGIVLFYLYDSSVLLYKNELKLIRYKSGLILRFSKDISRFMKRYLYLPNPFTPTIVEYQLLYPPKVPIYNDHCWMLFTVIDHVLTSLKPWTVLISLQLFTVIPFISIYYGSGPELLVAFSAVYATIILEFISLYKYKSLLGNHDLKYSLLFAESLLCPPFAVNIIRKISRLNNSWSFVDIVNLLEDDVKGRVIINDIWDHCEMEDGRNYCCESEINEDSRKKILEGQDDVR
jgi:hypothetical protein